MRQLQKYVHVIPFKKKYLTQNILEGSCDDIVNAFLDYLRKVKAKYKKFKINVVWQMMASAFRCLFSFSLIRDLRVQLIATYKHFWMNNDANWL